MYTGNSSPDQDTAPHSRGNGERHHRIHCCVLRREGKSNDPGLFEFHALLARARAYAPGQQFFWSATALGAEPIASYLSPDGEKTRSKRPGSKSECKRDDRLDWARLTNFTLAIS